jgi:hypothetical protein
MSTTEFEPDPFVGRLVVTAKTAFAALGVSKEKGGELIRSGLLETVSFGPRSTRVKVTSLRKLAREGIPKA